MAFLDDFKTAIDQYATNNCRIEILNYSIVGGGAVLNTGEIFQFKVRVINEHHLDMKDVRLEAQATSFADVSLAAGAFGPSALSSVFNLNQGQSHTTGFFRGKAKAATPGAQALDIVTVRISQWNASLDHILVDHSDAGSPEGKVTKNIDPT